MASEYYKGTGLKIQIEITAQGFDQSRDHYTIDVVSGDSVVTYSESNMVTDGEGHWLLPLPTDNLQEGRLKLVVTAYVPDDEFPGNIRKEVAEPIKVGVIKGVFQ